MSVYPQQPVVCVDARWPHPSPSPLKEGAIYTVASVGQSCGVGPDGYFTEGACLDLVEVKNPYDANIPGDPGFCASRFRPLNPKRIDVFLRMLKPVKEDA